MDSEVLGYIDKKSMIKNALYRKKDNRDVSFFWNVEGDSRTSEEYISSNYPEEQETIPQNKVLPLVSDLVANYYDEVHIYSSGYNNDHYFENISWEGYVVQIEGDVFRTRLKELEKNTTEEIAEFCIDDVSKDDLPLLKVGAAFYYSIGYASVKGQKKKEAMLRFKRNVKFTEDDVNDIAEKVKTLKNNLLFE